MQYVTNSPFVSSITEPLFTYYLFAFFIYVPCHLVYDFRANIFIQLFVCRIFLPLPVLQCPLLALLPFLLSIHMFYGYVYLFCWFKKILYLLLRHHSFFSSTTFPASSVHYSWFLNLPASLVFWHTLASATPTTDVLYFFSSSFIRGSFCVMLRVKGVDPDTKVGGDNSYMSTQIEVLEGQTGSHRAKRANFGRGVRGASPGKFKKPTWQMVQSTLFLSYICEYY